MKKLLILCVATFLLQSDEGLPLYYWREPSWENFGDYLSVKIVERIIEGPVRIYKKESEEKKLLGSGSIFYFAREGDVVWGSGINGKRIRNEDYTFTSLDVRSVRGPLSRQFLEENFGIECPEVYGDPALLLPYLFPEFQRNPTPQYEYLIIAHYLDVNYFPKNENAHIVHSTDPWEEIIMKILDSKFVISSSLHGIIVAEAFGIPAQLLRISEKEPWFKFYDYYLGTQRSSFRWATSIEEALEMGGEPPYSCNLEKLFNAFPFEYWPQASFYKPDFSRIIYDIPSS